MVHFLKGAFLKAATMLFSCVQPCAVRTRGNSHRNQINEKCAFYLFFASISSQINEQCLVCMCSPSRPSWADSVGLVFVEDDWRVCTFHILAKTWPKSREKPSPVIFKRKKIPISPDSDVSEPCSAMISHVQHKRTLFIFRCYLP